MAVDLPGIKKAKDLLWTIDTAALIANGMS
jgi:hypothetical protein